MPGTETRLHHSCRQHELVIIRDHPLVHTEHGLALLDTGSPLSFSKAGVAVDFAGQHHQTVAVQDFFAPIEDWLGQPINVLIGMDIMRRHVVEFDWPNRKLIVDSRPGNDYAATVPIEWQVGGLPCIMVRENGVPVTAVLDTGAHLSYATEGRVNAGIDPRRKPSHAAVGAGTRRAYPWRSH